MRLLFIVPTLFFLFGCAAVPLEDSGQKSQVINRASFSGSLASGQEGNPWWVLLDDPGLTQSIETVLAESFDLEQSRLRIERSRALAEQSRSKLFPRLNLEGSVSRNRGSTGNYPGVLTDDNRTLRQASTDLIATWELDLFGRLRQARIADEKLVEVSILEADALRLILCAETALRVIEIRSVQEQILLARESVQLESDFLDILSARQRGGIVTQADVLRAKAQLESSQANLERLGSSLIDATQALAVLLSTSPARAKEIVGEGRLPDTAGLELFSDTPTLVLLRRPDIRAAEARLRAASAELASAAASRFPRVNLLASVGLVTGSFSGLSTASATVSAITSSISWNVLDFGELESSVRAKRAFERSALVSYNNAVVSAFTDAESALRRVEARQAEATATRTAASTQFEAWTLAKVRYESGIGDLSTALEARRLANSIERDRINSQQALANAVIEVFRTVGYENWPLPTSVDG